jgi:hypothetical protein
MVQRVEALTAALTNVQRLWREKNDHWVEH